VSAACQKGALGNGGISGCGEGRTFNIIYWVIAGIVLYGKKEPFRSWPISANELEDVSSGSEANV
jgi:hypothetical protein